LDKKTADCVMTLDEMSDSRETGVRHSGILVDAFCPAKCREHLSFLNANIDFSMPHPMCLFNRELLIGKKTKTGPFTTSVSKRTVDKCNFF
jgi:hypothetical protein